MRYFDQKGNMFSNFSHIKLGNISMNEGYEKIKELWYTKKLPNLHKDNYPSYIYIEMIYGENKSHDSVKILDMSEEEF
jgi:hypothetical protein